METKTKDSDKNLDYFQEAITIIGLFINPEGMVNQINDLHKAIKEDKIYPSIDSTNITSISKLSTENKFNPSPLNTLSLTDGLNEKEIDPWESKKYETVVRSIAYTVNLAKKTLANTKVKKRDRSYTIPEKEVLSKKYKKFFKDLPKTSSDQRKLITRSFKVPKRKVFIGKLGQTVVDGDDDISEKHGIVFPEKIEKPLRIKKKSINKNKQVEKIRKINKINKIKSVIEHKKRKKTGDSLDKEK